MHGKEKTNIIHEGSKKNGGWLKFLIYIYIYIFVYVYMYIYTFIFSIYVYIEYNQSVFGG